MAYSLLTEQQAQTDCHANADGGKHQGGDPNTELVGGRC